MGIMLTDKHFSLYAKCPSRAVFVFNRDFIKLVKPVYGTAAFWTIIYGRRHMAVFRNWCTSSYCRGQMVSVWETLTMSLGILI